MKKVVAGAACGLIAAIPAVLLFRGETTGCADSVRAVDLYEVHYCPAGQYAHVHTGLRAERLVVICRCPESEKHAQPVEDAVERASDEMRAAASK